MPFDLTLKSYSENIDFQVDNKLEPDLRSQALVIRNDGGTWWIKVTVAGDVLELRTSKKFKEFRERRSEFEEFVRSLDYSSLSLLDDTVTEIVLTLSEEAQESMTFSLLEEHKKNDNIFIQHARRMSCKVREDPDRIAYPSCEDFPNLRKIDIGQLQKGERLSAAVVQVLFEKRMYAYKEIKRPGYLPCDTKNILEELKALVQFQGQQNIAQLAGIITSPNPYRTSASSDCLSVMTGILLEFYSMGSLEQIIKRGEANKYTWKNQTIQIGKGLMCMHEAQMAHNDIKLSNIVLDSEGNAVLIDISGVGGFTWEWLAPEMQKELQNQDYATPYDTSLRAQMLNDIWAYGKVLSIIAEHIGNSRFSQKLRDIAHGLMKEDPEARPSLSNTIMSLKELDESKVCI